MYWGLRVSIPPKVCAYGGTPLPKEGKIMVHWEHRYLLGTMIFTIAGDVVRDFDEEYEAWSWLEQEGWGLVGIEPPDPIRPGLRQLRLSAGPARQHAVPRGGTRGFHDRREE